MTEGNYSNVGHRGPVYKGLGAMNPCDLSSVGVAFLEVTKYRERKKKISFSSQEQIT
jgi:hypothetical protein